MTMRRIAAAFCLLAACICLCACAGGDISRIKLNADKVNEYNEAIGLYNKLAIALTELAKLVDKEAAKDEGFEDSFWQSYDVQKDKVISCMKHVEDFHFNYQDIAVVSGDIRLLCEDLKAYLLYMEDYRHNGDVVSRKQFKESHRKRYNAMMEQSTQIVKVFDGLYETAIIGQNE